MTCNECENKHKKSCSTFPKSVIEIDNPETITLLRKVVIPASLGDDTDIPAAVGKYRNVILHYEANKHTYLYSSDGIPTLLEVEVSPEVLDRITALEDGLAAEIETRQDADTSIQNDITAIEEKIPNAASSQNQLADKNFVNSSIATNTANYISNNGEPFTSVAQLEAYSGTVSNNDYAFVTGTDSSGNTYYDRYKATVTGEPPVVTWAKEYRLNNSSFTSDQWAAINSGIASGGVEKLNGLANIKTIGANLTLDANGELSGSGGPSGIPTSAKFWGASYDDVNDKVDGPLTITNEFSSGSRSLSIGTPITSITSAPEGINHLHYSTQYQGLFLKSSYYTGWMFNDGRLLGQAFGTTGFFQSNFNTPIFTIDSGAKISANSHRIQEVLDPVSAQDAATKNYVDAAKPHYEGYMQEYTTTANTGTINLHEITVSEGGVYLVTLSGWVNENGVTHAGSIYPYLQIADAATVYANTQTIISDTTANTNEQQTLSAMAIISLSANDKVYLRFGQSNTAAAGMKYNYSYGVIKLSN